LQARKRLFQSGKIQEKINSHHKTVIIGITGASFGVGTTHLAFAMGTYFNKLGVKTALIEDSGNRSSSFESVEEAYNGGVEREEACFRIKKMHFYKQFRGEVHRLKEEGYAILIVDFGVFSEKILEAFNRTDIKLFVGHGSEWKMKEIEMIFQQIELSDRSGWKLIIPFGDKTDIKQIKKDIGVIGIPFGYYKDPFLWCKSMSREIERILSV